MENPLTENERDVLLSAIVARGWYLEASNIVATARLMERGFLVAEDDYEGPTTRATKDGIAFAEGLGAVEWDTNASAWTYTNTERNRKKAA